MQNCPDITLSNYLFVFLFFQLFVISSFCPFSSFCLFVFLVLLVFFPFFVLLSRHHSDQMSDGSQLSKVTLCVQIVSGSSELRNLQMQVPILSDTKQASPERRRLSVDRAQDRWSHPTFYFPVYISLPKSFCSWLVILPSFVDIVFVFVLLYISQTSHSKQIYRKLYNVDRAQDRWFYPLCVYCYGYFFAKTNLLRSSSIYTFCYDEQIHKLEKSKD